MIEATKETNETNVAEMSATNSKPTEYEEQAEQFEKLKKQSNANCIEQAEILNKVKTEKEKYYKDFLKDKRVGFASSQAKKYIRVYKYYKEKEGNGQTTVQIIKLGIEKTDAIIKLINKAIYSELETFVLDNNISVSMIKKTVKMLNQNPESTIQEAYNKVIEQKNQNKKSEQVFNEQNIADIKLSPIYKALEEKIKIVEAENQHLKERLKLFENAKNRQASARTNQHVPNNTPKRKSLFNKLNSKEEV